MQPLSYALNSFRNFVCDSKKICKASFSLLLLLVIFAKIGRAQDTFGIGNGHSGALTVNASGTVVNVYTKLTAVAPVSQSFVTVTSTTGFAVGDLVMVLQHKVATPIATSGTQTDFSLSTAAPGTWELKRVTALTATRLTFTGGPLTNAFSVNSQVIKVPEYTTVTINAAGSIVPQAWDGLTGGVVAFMATGNVTVNGTINANGRGFLGGVYQQNTVGTQGIGFDALSAGKKGESFNVLANNVSFGMGNMGNGGGGGNAFQSGGGGGSNGGQGGNGGQTFGETPNRAVGGLGGAKLLYSPITRLMLGGGGGAGDGQDADLFIGGSGAAGGGIVFVRCASKTGAGNITANGDTPAAFTSAAEIGAGGGGAGGTIYFRATGSITNGNFIANGGAGGANPSSSKAPGGGGSGGMILVQGAGYSDSPSVLGGAAGTEQGGTTYGASGGAIGTVITYNTGMVTPSAPVLVTPANGSTTSLRPVVSGTAAASVDVDINIDGVKITTATSDVSGNFTYTPTSDLSVGAHIVNAKASVLGLVSPVSNTNTFTVAGSPTITSVAYDAAGGILTVGGTNFTSSAASDVIAGKFTFTGQGNSPYVLTSTSDVEISSATAFTLTLSAGDRAALRNVLTANGTAAADGTTFNLSLAAGWMDGSASNQSLTNAITVSNYIKSAQAISFIAQTKTYGDADFSPAIATSGLPVSYVSDNLAVATIVADQIHIVGVGTANITASQSGNYAYNAASDVTRSLTVNKAVASQQINFPAIPLKYSNQTDFAPATSGLAAPITYASSNTDVATIVGGLVHIVGIGTTTITASQVAEDANHLAPDPVAQTLTVDQALVPAVGGIVYVKKGSSLGDGNSWGTAIDELANALKRAKEINAATPGTVKEIWVAKGTYLPKYSAGDSDFGTPASRNNTFLLVKDVKIYGGFAGTEASLNDRDLSLVANKSILSGDLNGNDQTSGTITSNSDNANHVVLSVGDVGTALLDGFSIVGGNADVAATITVGGKTINQAMGAGIYLMVSSPKITNCIISGNTATANSNGAGIYNNAGAPVITNTLISGNKATGNDSGAGIYSVYALPQLINTTISGNNATGTASAGVYHKLSSPTLTNTVIYGNSAGIVEDNTGSGTVSNTGYVNPTVGENTVKGGGAEAWSNPQSSLSDNNSYTTFANAALLIGGTLRNSDYLTIKGLGFAVPANAQILGVQVEVRKFSSDNSGSNWSRDLDIKLVKGGIATGTNHGNTGVNWPTSETAFTYGTNSDLWGTTLTPADINASDFGVAVAIESRAAGLLLPTVISYVDQVRVNVYYRIDAVTTVAYSLVQGGFTGTGNLNVDPKFANPIVSTTAPAVGGDYSLLAGSPALNVGDNTATTETKDLTGGARVKNTTIDLGAYERQALLQSITGLGPLTKTYGDADFEPAGAVSSGLTISYASADPTVAATYQDAADGNKWKIKILKAGTVNITASQPGDAGHDPADDVVFALTINKATTTLTLSNLTPTYDGTGKAPTVTTNPVGLTGVAITYDGSTTLPTLAGTYAVVASLTNDNYTATNATGNLVIGKATATITLSNLSPTYDGTGKAAMVTTNPLGLTGVAITYDGSTTLPTLAGTYAVVATLTNNNYTATDATGNLVIGKATATITLNNLTPTYDGTGKAATATTNPVGLTGVAFTYDGNTTLPTQAGTYAVVASLTNDNYTATNATGNLIIGKATATLTLGNLSQGYDGSAKSVTVTTNPIGLTGVSVTYDGGSTLPSITGTYAVVASLSNANYAASNATGNLVIVGGLSQTISFAGLATKTYGNAPFQLNATGGNSTSPVTFVSSDPAIASISGNTVTIHAAGSVTITASQAADVNYNAALDVPQTLTINKASASISLSDLSYTYDGTGKAATATTNPVGLSGVTVTYDGSATLPTAAGTYAVVASLTNNNYTATNATGSLVIDKATATLSLSNLTPTYDGTGKAATLTTNPVGLSGITLTYDGSTTLPTEAGTYAVVASLTNNNYTAGNATGNLVIGKATATLALSNLTQTYDGAGKNATVTTNPVGLSGVAITYDGSATLPTLAGTYAVVATLTNNNYTASNATGSLVIDKATATLTLSNLTATYDGTGKAATVTTNPVGLSGVAITYDGNSTLPTEAGTYAVVASLNNANYVASNATGNLVIGKASATLTLSNLTATYDGTGKAAIATTNPVGLSGVSITYDGSATLPTEAGTYAVVASLTHNNYTASNATGSLVIGKASATLTLSNLTATYDGTGKAATVTTNPIGLSGVTVTYDGSSTLPTAAGTYAVVASLTHNNYAATNATGNLVIGKATATLTLSNLTATYDGTGKAATATTNPVGLSGVTVTYDGSATLPTEAGTYAIIASLSNGNYTASNATGNLVIGKASATLTLSNLTSTYDGTGKAATVTTNPVGLSGVTVTYDGSTTLPTAAGTYAVVASLANNNYTATNATGNLVIGKASATLTLSNLTSTYDGTGKAAFVTTNPVGLTGVTVTYGGNTTLPTQAGTYAVVANLNNANYDANNATANLIIGKKTVNVTVDAKNKTYGDADPVFTYTFSPALVSGDAFTGTLSRVAGENIGTYAISQNTLSAGANYTLNFAGADLTIGKKIIAVVADAKSKVYGSADPTLTYTFSPALKTGDSFSGLLSRATGEVVGSYAINQNTLALNGNYTLSFTGGSFAVAKASLSIKADNKTRAFGAANPALTATYTGFVSGETNAVLSSQPVLATVAVAASPAGTYPITVSGATAANYDISFVPGTLTIGQTSQTVTFGHLADKLSTDVPFALTATASSGLTVAFASSDISIARIINGNQVEILKPGTVNITASQAGDANYLPAAAVVQSLKINDNSAFSVNIVSSKGNTIGLGETTVLTASGAVSYQWATANGIISGQNTATLTVRPSANTVYTVTGTNPYGRTTTQTIEIKVTNDLSLVTATNILSPNGDGVNDVWVVDNIDMYPNNTVTIVDRAGRPVFKVKGYKNNWDATLNGAQLQEGTYYYVIDFGVPNKMAKKGFITIVR